MPELKGYIMTLSAKFNGTCRSCGARIRQGDRINWTRHGGAQCLRHVSTSERAAYNAEYSRGIADYEREKFNTETFGEDYAVAEELAWSLKDPDPAY